jgi:hypothetical protein
MMRMMKRSQVVRDGEMVVVGEVGLVGAVVVVVVEVEVEVEVGQMLREERLGGEEYWWG